MRESAIILAVGFLVGVGTPAHAALLTYDLEGTVTQVGTSVEIPLSVGDQIPIAITVDSAYPGGPIYSFNGSYVPGAPYTNLIKSALFDSRDSNGLFQTIDIGPSSINFFTANPMTGSGFNLALTGARSGTFPTFALPTTLNPADFSSGAFSVIEAFSAQTYGYSGIINGVVPSAVPEPPTWELLGAGLLGLCWTMRRVFATD